MRPVRILCRLRVTFRREVKLGYCRESRVWGVGLLANLCSLCTFNLCSVEETNILWTNLKLEVSEQRTIPFPCTIPCGLATWWAKAPSSCSVSAPALPASPLLLELDSLVSCCCFLAMLALRSTMVFLHVFYWFKKKQQKNQKNNLKKEKKKYFRSVLTIVLSCTEPRSLESSRDKVCYAAPSFLRVWFVPMPLL